MVEYNVMLVARLLHTPFDTILDWAEDDFNRRLDIINSRKLFEKVML